MQWDWETGRSKISKRKLSNKTKYSRDLVDLRTIHININLEHRLFSKNEPGDPYTGMELI